MKRTLRAAAAALLLPPSLCLAALVPPLTAGPSTTTSETSTPRTTSSSSSSSSSSPEATNALNQRVSAATASFERTDSCFRLEDELKADLAKKKLDLATEFHGKIPLEFNDLLWQKTQRVAKQHAACFQQYDALGRDLNALHDEFRSMGPLKKSVGKQLAAVSALRAKYVLLVPTTKPRAKAPAKATE